MLELALSNASDAGTETLEMWRTNRSGCSRLTTRRQDQYIQTRASRARFIIANAIENEEKWRGTTHIGADVESKEPWHAVGLRATKSAKRWKICWCMCPGGDPVVIQGNLHGRWYIRQILTLVWSRCHSSMGMHVFSRWQCSTPSNTHFCWSPRQECVASDISFTCYCTVIFHICWISFLNFC